MLAILSRKIQDELFGVLVDMKESDDIQDKSVACEADLTFPHNVGHIGQAARILRLWGMEGGRLTPIYHGWHHQLRHPRLLAPHSAENEVILPATCDRDVWGFTWRMWGQVTAPPCQSIISSIWYPLAVPRPGLVLQDKVTGRLVLWVKASRRPSHPRL